MFSFIRNNFDILTKKIYIFENFIDNHFSPSQVNPNPELML